jgi:alpha-tubulin suppressor-like RCC1 family protein
MHHTAALLDSGDMYLWGAGEYGRLGLDDEQQQVLAFELYGGIAAFDCNFRRRTLRRSA